MKRAIIVGSKGQDGRILFDRLRGDGCVVLGITRDAVESTQPFGLSKIDIARPDEVLQAVQVFRPDEIYYLAAFHHSSEDRLAPDVGEVFERSYQVHVRGLIHFLEAIRKENSRCRLFYAASSHVF